MGTTGRDEVVTERLVLRPVRDDDLDVLFDLGSDPRVWTHLPSGRHTSPATTRAQLDRFLAAWSRDGLGYWLAHRRDDGAFVGVGGVMGVPGPVWNVYYRVHPDQQGHRFAVEFVAAARDAARRVAPDVPVTAYLLERNTASRRTIERAGLRQVWRGPDAGEPDAVRLVYADRDLPAEVLATVLRRP